MELISAQHLSKRAGRGLAIDDVTLDVESGSITAVFGGNGSGKSLLLRCLAGLEAPTSGTIEVEGKARISTALQKPGLAADLSVAENLSLFASLSDVPGKRRANRVAHVMQELSLIEYKNSRVSSLSPGTLARVEIARAFVPDSHVVLIDGLLDMLDHAGAEEVWRLICKWRRENGVAFVIATTRGEHAGRCDRVVLMSRGRVAASGSPAELKAACRPDTVLVDVVRNPLLRSKIKNRLAIAVEDAQGMLKFHSTDPTGVVLDLLTEHGSDVGAVYVRQPTMDDVLLQLTGGDADVG